MAEPTKEMKSVLGQELREAVLFAETGEMEAAGEELLKLFRHLKIAARAVKR